MSVIEKTTLHGSYTPIPHPTPTKRKRNKKNQKNKTKTVIDYRDYNPFQSNNFKEELTSELLDLNIEEYDQQFSHYFNICEKMENKMHL